MNTVSHNGVTFEEMVDKLVKSPDQLFAETTPAKLALDHAAKGIAGEAGEIIDSIKKHTVYNQTLDIENLIEELGDLEFYMQDLRRRIGVSREQCLEANMRKLAKRYGEDYSYTNQKAKDRADKDGYAAAVASVATSTLVAAASLPRL